MLTLRPTKMLAKRLRIALPDTPPPVPNRVADWCVHEFRDGGYRYLIFCNTASLYPLVTYGRGVNDDGALIECFIETLRTNCAGTELAFQYQRHLVPALGAVQWAPIPDRSVLGSINELVAGARHGMGKSPVELSRWLAETPLHVLGYDSPDRVFAQLRG